MEIVYQSVTDPDSGRIQAITGRQMDRSLLMGRQWLLPWTTARRSSEAKEYCFNKDVVVDSGFIDEPRMCECQILSH